MNQKVIIINDIIIELEISKLSIEIDYVGGGGGGGGGCRKFYIPQNYIQVAFLCIKNIVPIKSCATFGGGGQPDFSDPDFGKINFHIGKIGKQFFAKTPISPSLITLGHMLIHNFYINVLIALILVYRNSM